MGNLRKRLTLEAVVAIIAMIYMFVTSVMLIMARSGDLNFDTKVNLKDLSIMAQNYEQNQ